MISGIKNKKHKITIIITLAVLQVITCLCSLIIHKNNCGIKTIINKNIATTLITFSVTLSAFLIAIMGCSLTNDIVDYFSFKTKNIIHIPTSKDLNQKCIDKTTHCLKSNSNPTKKINQAKPPLKDLCTIKKERSILQACTIKIKDIFSTKKFKNLSETDFFLTKTPSKQNNANNLIRSKSQDNAQKSVQMSITFTIIALPKQLSIWLENIIKKISTTLYKSQFSNVTTEEYYGSTYKDKDEYSKKDYRQNPRKFIEANFRLIPAKNQDNITNHQIVVFNVRFDEHSKTIFITPLDIKHNKIETAFINSAESNVPSCKARILQQGKKILIGATCTIKELCTNLQIFTSKKTSSKRNEKETGLDKKRLFNQQNLQIYPIIVQKSELQEKYDDEIELMRDDPEIFSMQCDNRMIVQKSESQKKYDDKEIDDDDEIELMRGDPEIFSMQCDNKTIVQKSELQEKYDDEIELMRDDPEIFSMQCDNRMIVQKSESQKKYDDKEIDDDDEIELMRGDPEIFSIQYDSSDESTKEISHITPCKIKKTQAAINLATTHGIENRSQCMNFNQSTEKNPGKERFTNKWKDLSNILQSACSTSKKSLPFKLNICSLTLNSFNLTEERVEALYEFLEKHNKDHGLKNDFLTKAISFSGKTLIHIIFENIGKEPETYNESSTMFKCMLHFTGRVGEVRSSNQSTPLHLLVINFTLSPLKFIKLYNKCKFIDYQDALWEKNTDHKSPGEILYDKYYFTNKLLIKNKAILNFQRFFTSLSESEPHSKFSEAVNFLMTSVDIKNFSNHPSVDISFSTNCL